MVKIDADDEFRSKAESVSARILKRIETSLENIRSLGTLFNTSLYVDPDQFRLFAGQKTERYKHIRSAFYMPLVTEKQRKKFEENMEDDGYIGYKIRSVVSGVNRSKRKQIRKLVKRYLPVKYIEPHTPKSIRNLGYDYLSVTGFKILVEKAIHTGNVVVFVEDESSNKSFDTILLMTAVYAGKSLPANKKERNSGFNGIVALSINMTEILTNIDNTIGMDISITKMDGRGKDHKQNTASRNKRRKNIVYWHEATYPIVSRQSSLKLLIREPVYWHSREVIISVMAGLIGLIITILMVGVVRINALRSRDLANQNAEIQNQVILKTEELAMEKVALENEIAQRKKTEKNLVKLSSALENAGDSIFITDLQGIIEYVNPSFEQISGYSRDEVLGKKSDIISSGKHNGKFFEKLWSTIGHGNTFRDVLINRNKSGKIYYEQKSISPVRDDNGEVCNYVSTGKDITEQILAKEKLEFLALHDPLTKLPNRSYLGNRIDQEIHYASENSEVFSVMFVDLDRFKYVNDSLGHDAGDMLIIEIAKRFVSCIREQDTVARLGGDEFTIILNNISQPDNAALIADKVMETLAEKVILSGHDIYVTASIGIAIYPYDGQDKKTLMKNADIAMYHAKENGKNTYQFFTPELGRNDSQRFKMEDELRKAIENKEFFLEYQPQVDMVTREVTGMEALIRWRHPDKGVIYPVSFLDILEDTGLITVVGRWVFRTACEQNKKWQRDGYKPFRIAVNLSNKQFHEDALVSNLVEIFDHVDLDASWIDIELTENILMDDSDEFSQKLCSLSEAGMSISIDDFGTGFSSLERLRKTKVDYLKIDKSFVAGVGKETKEDAIIRSIVAIAHSLDMEVIAEGVETEDQYEYLKACGCDQIQGYLISRPLEEYDATRYLSKKHPRVSKTGNCSNVIDLSSTKNKKVPGN